MIAASKKGVDPDYLSQAREQRLGSEAEESKNDLKGIPASKRRASRVAAPRDLEEQKDRDRRVPRSPPQPPRQHSHQEVKGKGKGKNKKGGKTRP